MNNLWSDIKYVKSTDDNVSKFIFTKNDAVAESVLYKYPTYEDRTVICCSTQSGCPVGCRFCGAGDYFVRSLTAEEIVNQSDHLLEQTGVNPASIKRLQIMFMSMGETLLNWGELSQAIKTLSVSYPQAKLLISTSAPRGFKKWDELYSLSQDIPNIGLQFSVHESTDEKRKALIPSPTLSLEEIARRGVEWACATRRAPYFNYCVHAENNSQEDVDRLKYFFNPKVWESTISVICERDEHVVAANSRQRQLASDFMDKMLAAGFSCRMFDPAGQDDVGGGCGQLWYVQDWMRGNPDKAKKSLGYGKPVVHTPASHGNSPSIFS